MLVLGMGMVCVDLPTKNEAVYEVEVAKVPKVEAVYQTWPERGKKRVLKGWGPWSILSG